MIKRIYFALLASLSVFGIGLSSLHAEPAGAIGDNFIYIVEPGDTLSELATLYTTRSGLWRQLQNINNVQDELALPIGMQLEIPFPLIPVVATDAQLSHTQGSVWVNDQSVSAAVSLKAGDIIRTGSNGFATLKLEDQSTLSLPNNSQLHIRQLNAFERARLTDAILELQAGTVESRVAPEHTGVGRFEIHTPLSVTGVRGTDLRIHTTPAAAMTELLSGKAHYDTRTQQLQSLKATQGVSIQADGTSSIVPLLAAPTLSEPERGAQGWQVMLEPVAGAQYYVVQVSLDPEGSQLVKHYETAADQRIIPLLSSGPGEHYAFIRAVDKDGLMGLDATTAFPGQLTLTSSDGSSVSSGFGSPILLNHY
ncbi:FecR domain-containing protein [Paenalcaligenes hominis]|uniref:FecR domain-containing protein n=1 Tax=Paenalcaligenes hominis TaxID=643674 RepID=UPI003523360E